MSWNKGCHPQSLKESLHWKKTQQGQYSSPSASKSGSLILRGPTKWMTLKMGPTSALLYGFDLSKGSGFASNCYWKIPSALISIVKRQESDVQHVLSGLLSRTTRKTAAAGRQTAAVWCESYSLKPSNRGHLKTVSASSESSFTIQANGITDSCCEMSSHGFCARHCARSRATQLRLHDKSTCSHATSASSNLETGMAVEWFKLTVMSVAALRCVVPAKRWPNCLDSLSTCHSNAEHAKSGCQAGRNLPTGWTDWREKE